MDAPASGILVVLVIPAHTDGRRGEPAEYLGTGYLASALEARGIPCELVQADLFGLKANQVAQIVAFLRPRVIGFSIMQPAVRQVARVVRLLADTGDGAPRPTILLGGHYPTLAPAPLLRELPEVDYVLRGDAEVSFVQFVVRVLEGHPVTDVPDLVYRGPDGHPHEVPAERRLPLDSLPFPDRRFLRTVIAAGGECNVCSSRGCHWDCYFCCAPAYASASPGPHWSGRYPEDIVREMTQLRDAYQFDEVLFNDDNFLGGGTRGVERARRLAELLIETRLRLTFSLFCMADGVDHDTFSQLARAGLRTALEEIHHNLAQLERIRARDRHAISFRHLLSRLRLYDSTPIARELERDHQIIPNDPLSGYDGYRMSLPVQSFYDTVTAMYRDRFSPHVAFLDRVAAARHSASESAREAIELKADLFDGFADWYAMLLERSLGRRCEVVSVAEAPGLASTLGRIEDLSRRALAGECPVLRIHPFTHLPCVHDIAESRFCPRLDWQRAGAVAGLSPASGGSTDASTVPC